MNLSLQEKLKQGNILAIKSERKYMLPVFILYDENFTTETGCLSAEEEFVILDIKPESGNVSKISIYIMISNRNQPAIGWIRPHIDFVESNFVKIL